MSQTRTNTGACAGGSALHHLNNRAWIQQTEEHAVQLQQKLESDLVAYKNQLIKESIRMGNNDLGDFYYNRGDLQV